MPYVREQTVADLERDLRAMRARLADGERELEALRTRLNLFGTRYQVTVGDRFELLRKLQAAAGESAPATDASVADGPNGPSRLRRPPGHTEFERLYRDLARRVHPDLARDPAELRLRTRVMAELNSARETLDFDRVRRLGDAWEFRPEDIAPEPGIGPVERLTQAIERVQARLTAVTADVTRLRSSNLHLLMNIVEAQRRAGVDMLSETAADLDLQIADARARMALAPRHPGDMSPRPERPLALHTTLAGRAAARGPLFMGSAIIAGSFALVAALAAASGVERAAPVITVPTPAPHTSPPAIAEPTPAPLAYRVLGRELSTTGRSTAIVRIVLDQTPTNPEKASTLAAAARAELRAQQAVVVFAYRSDSEIGGPFTIGRSYLSVDGRGFSGDGKTEDGPDTGGITGSIVIGLGQTLETQPFTARR